MSDHFKQIYATRPEKYDRLVSREDQKGRLFEALMEIAPFAGLRCVDFGAGTGRLTRQLALLAEQVYAVDTEIAMLRTAHQVLEESGLTNWHLIQANNRAVPLPDNCVDLAVEGWSFAHAASWYPDDWQDECRRMINEMQRIVKPGGAIILIETLGTNQRQPQPPTDQLGAVYQWWAKEYDLQYRWVRTDYQFASLDEADDLIRFFFGDEMADDVVASGREIVPECTGIWWRRI